MLNVLLRCQKGVKKCYELNTIFDTCFLSAVFFTFACEISAPWGVKLDVFWMPIDVKLDAVEYLEDLVLRIS